MRISFKVLTTMIKKLRKGKQTRQNFTIGGQDLLQEIFCGVFFSVFCTTVADI